MTLRVVGAGLGRTGTHSLQLALQQLLDAPCYHMMEVFAHPEHIAMWQGIVDGNPPDWTFLADYGATVDWPAAAYWRELGAENPDAVVLLSTRESADAWWKSANSTIFEISRRPPAAPDPLFDAQMKMATDLFRKTFTAEWTDEDSAKRAYEAHNDAVRAGAPSDRLVEWQPGDGWEPLCTALGLPVPDEPFPHVNTTDEFRAMLGLDAPA